MLVAGSTSAAGGFCAKRRNKLFGPSRARIEKLHRNVVVGQPERDLLGPLRLEPEGGARRRDVNHPRVGTRAAPAAGALDDLAPERASPAHPLDAARVCPAASAETPTRL